VAGRLKGPATLVLQLTGVLGLLVASIVCTPSAEADPGSLQSQEWWISRLGLGDAWKISKGAGVTVAVLDSGVKASVGDLRGAVLPGFDSSGPGDARTDPDGHGTSMAVEIAGRGSNPGMLGVAPAAKILPVVVPIQNENDYTVVALNKLSASAHPPQVVSMSYGEAGACPTDLQAAIKKAVDKGMILVASAGNEGSSTNQSQSPANCAGVVAVGAFGNDLKPWVKSQRQPYVGLAGPGVHIVGYDAATLKTAYYNGTSDAAAIVSASIALVRSHFPQMPSRQLVARFIATARQFDGAQGTHSDVLGWGAARPHHALIDKVSANAPNPIYDALATVSTGEPSAHPSSSATSSTATTPRSQASTGTGHAASSSSNTGVVIGIVAAVVVVVLLVIGFALRQRRRARWVR